MHMIKYSINSVKTYFSSIRNIILWRRHRAWYDDAQVVMSRWMMRWRSMSMRFVGMTMWRRGRSGWRRRCAASVQWRSWTGITVWHLEHSAAWVHWKWTILINRQHYVYLGGVVVANATGVLKDLGFDSRV